MSSKFAKNSRTQTTPRVCKPPPPEWRWVPLPSYPTINVTIFWSGDAFHPEPGVERPFYYFERFSMKYEPAMNWYRREIIHTDDRLLLVVTPEPAEKRVAIVCGYWVPGRNPVSDSWYAGHLQPGNWWYTKKQFYNPHQDPETRILILNV